MKAAQNVGIIDWFAVFLLLFIVFLSLKWLFPALVTVIIFSSIFAWFYHTRLDVPRTEQEKIVLSNWYAWLEQRWKENPPKVHGIEYYLNHAPYDLTIYSVMGIVFRIALFALSAWLLFNAIMLTLREFF